MTHVTQPRLQASLLLRYAATLVVAAGLIGQAGVAQAQITGFLTKTGRIHVSVDGVGTNNPPATIDVDKPSAASTVSSAHVACAATGFTGQPVVDGQVSIGGIAVNGLAQVVNGGFNNALADVTASHGALLNALPVGISALSYNEANTFLVEGCSLAVIWNFPEAPSVQTAILLFGGQSTTGDQFTINLVDPIDLSDPDLKLDLGLAISFGAQDQLGFAGSNLCGHNSGMFSLIDVNSNRMTSCAGNADDGVSTEPIQDGLLYTVGGIGDSNANPAFPLLTAPQPPPSFVEDELYTLVPFVSNGDTQIVVDTVNPSNDDNIHFAWLCTSGVARLEDCDNGVDDDFDGLVDLDDPDCVFCGNGILETANGEECDDGNIDNGDGCDENCLVEAPPVVIDIKPGSDPNAINPMQMGLVPVAILGSDSFDVDDVDPDSLAFGPSGATRAHPNGPHYDDVNEDGFTDLLAHFTVKETGIAFGDVEACLTGTIMAVPFEACDDIKTVPACGIGFELVFLLPPLMWVYRRRGTRPA
jgi:cysteine-rich repeat protein